VVATHSPSLLAVREPGSLQIDSDGHIEQVDHDDADTVALTRGVLTDPQRFPRHLLPEAEPPAGQ
jgi:predicted ATPase